MLDPAAAMGQLVALVALKIDWMGIVAVVVGIGVAEKELPLEVVVVLARDEVVRKARAKTPETETAMENEYEPSSAPGDDGISYSASVARKHW